MTTNDTERKYKQGFVREDGKIFHAYQRRKNGTLRESWMTPEAYDNYRCKVREWINNNYDRHRENVRRSVERINAERFPNSSEITRSIIESNAPINYRDAN